MSSLPPLPPVRTPAEAVALQRALAPRVREEALPPVGTVAGVDVSVRAGRVRAAVVVLGLPGLDVRDAAVWEGEVAFPYVPGLLSFRELPALWPALERLAVWPDAFLLDGQGRAHPRRFGLACHLGVLLDVPAVGVAKSLLVGRHGPLGEARGSTADLGHGGEVVGRAVRTRAGVRPVYVSVGHRATLDDAVALVLRCTTRFRLPEPTRRAHLLSRGARPDG